MTVSGNRGWTLHTLRVYFVDQIAALGLLMQQRFDAQEQAIGKAEASSEKRFESVNAFRAQLTDQARTFLTRLEYDGAHQGLIDRIDADQQRSNQARVVLADKMDAEAARTSERLREVELRLSSRLDLLQGATIGSGRAQALFFAVGGLVVSALAVLLTLVLLHH